MAMGKRTRHAKQASMWVAIQDLPRSAAHPFYARLNQILDQQDFDGFVEGLCERFYGQKTEQFERAIGLTVGSAKLAHSEQIARDVVIFWAQKSGSGR
jgi:hypothetical protein